MQLLHPVILYAAAGTIILRFLVNLYRVLRNPLSKVPGPWYAKWTDWVKTYYVVTAQGPVYIHSLHQKYGPVVRVAPNHVDVAEPAAVQRIHRIRGEFRKSSWYTDLLPGFENVFNTRDIDQHRRYRKLLSGPISESGLTKVLSQIEGKVQLTIDRISEEMKFRGAADTNKWWMFMTTDVIGELSFGESFRMLEYGKKNQYIHDLERVGLSGAMRVNFPLLWRLSNYLPLPFFKATREMTMRNRRYGMQSLERHRTLVENNDANVKATLFSKMYKAEDDDSLSPKEILDNATTYIVAGSDTTANTLTYLVWAVCKHPEIRDRLAKEVSTLPEDFSHEDVKGLHYLNLVIEESLRLYSAVPSPLPREVPKGGESLGNYWIPEGVTASTQAYTLHRDPQAFPYPNRFDPSRWENPTKAMKDMFIPFGGGSRVCLGIHLAYMELRFATARFFKRFPHATVSNIEGMSDDDMEPKLFFLLSPRGQRCLIQAS